MICSMQSIWIQQIVKKLKEVKCKQQRKPNNIERKKRYKNKMSKVRQNVSYAEEHLVFNFAAMWVRASDANSVFCMGLFFYSLAFGPSHSGVIWYWTRSRPHTIKICILYKRFVDANALPW